MASSWEDFLAMGKSNLEDFLAVRGISKSGRKIELVAKAFSAVQMNLPIVFSSEEMQKRLNSEYLARLQRYGIVDPREIPTGQRNDDITKWPPITLGRVFEYILKCKDFETDYIPTSIVGCRPDHDIREWRHNVYVLQCSVFHDSIEHKQSLGCCKTRWSCFDGVVLLHGR